MFNPASIGSLNVPNRYIRSATAEFAANPDGTVTNEYLELYTNLALGEVGLIIQGHLYIMDEGKAHEKMAGIAHEFHVNGLKRITQSVHNAGTESKITAQLNHGGIHSISKKAPSKIDDKASLAMTDEDIENVILSFGKAAVKAKIAGYDAVQIHAAHSYLVSQFLSSESNKRNDSWGGSIDNRSNILLSIYQKIRAQVGPGFPILAKMNNSDEPRAGFPVEEAVKVAKWLAEEGLDALEISGMQTTRTKFEEEAYYSKNAQIIKQNIGDMPLSVVGGIRSLKVIKQLHQEFADFISICRPFIREPDLVKQFREGKKKADCISCNKCFRPTEIITCRDEGFLGEISKNYI
jgi:2,4-dienoyl-CoA reductase-like NADH-dependent reductase (Old Yellow Enzyme family)